MSKKRAVCLNCMDGRAQIPVINWIKGHYPVADVDMITEPGMDGLLADAGEDVEDVLSKVQLSIELNDAKFIFVAGHHDCRGNPVESREHQQHIRSAVERLQPLFSDMKVVGIWINADWQGEICSPDSATDI